MRGHRRFSEQVIFSGNFVRYGAAMIRLAPPAALLLLAACSKADNDPGPGGVTMGEARALDDAAQMIEAQRLAPEAIPPADAAGVAAQQNKAPAQE